MKLLSCLFFRDGDGWACSRCGRRVRVESDKPPTARCRAAAGLGDAVAVALESVGITKDRVSAMIGEPCRCPERQAALNKFGKKYFGIGADGDAS